MKFVRLIVPLLALIPSLPALAGGVLIMGTAQTIAGRFFAAGLMAAAVAILLGAAVVATRRRRRSALAKAALVHAAGAFGLLTICYALAPDGAVPDGASFRSRWDGRPAFARGSPGNLVPEVDQVSAALWLFPYFDSEAPTASVRRLGAALLQSYYGLAGDRGFVSAISALPAYYREALRLPVEPGHLFSYLPRGGEGEGAAGGALPVIIYLHGEGGNLKAGVWNWRTFADAHGYAVLAPTRSAGSWDSDAAIEAIGAALEAAREDPRLDAGRVILVGCGAGGMGLPRASLAFPGAFDQLIFISSQMDASALRSRRLWEQWKGKRVLFVHGEQDLRSPLPELQKEVSPLREQGVEVFLKVFPGEDQFVFWTRKNDLFQLIGDWLG